MTTVLKPKRSEVAASIPTTGQLEVGEIALNITDGKFYTKTSSNIVKEVGGAGAVTLQGVTNVGATTTNDIVLNGSNLIFEGALENAFETILTVAEPTGDRTITLPNISGTVITTGDTGTVSTTMIASDAVTEAKIADDAVGQDQLKTLVTLQILNSTGGVLKTIYGAGA